MAFSKSQRVVSSEDFTRILRRGACAADGVLVLFAVRGADNVPSRLGITIPKKVGNAVARNQWKRWIRESYRTQQNRIPNGYDFVVRPKKGAQPSWSSIQKAVPYLANKAIKRIASDSR